MYVCIVHGCDVEHLESRKYRIFAESQSSITVQALGLWVFDVGS